MKPHLLPSKRRWTITFDGFGTVVVERQDDLWQFIDGGDPDDPSSAAGMLMRYVRFGWPWLPGFSLPSTGLHEEMEYQLTLEGATVTVDPPLPSGPEIEPDEYTIVG
jgi:hypothetical protein